MAKHHTSFAKGDLPDYLQIKVTFVWKDGYPLRNVNGPCWPRHHSFWVRKNAIERLDCCLETFLLPKISGFICADGNIGSRREWGFPQLCRSGLIYSIVLERPETNPVKPSRTRAVLGASGHGCVSARFDPATKRARG